MTDQQLDQTPDAFNSDDECGAWRPGPRVIGQGSHTHVCRRFPEHEPPHRCMCGADFSSRRIA